MAHIRFPVSGNPVSGVEKGGDVQGAGCIAPAARRAAGCRIGTSPKPRSKTHESDSNAFERRPRTFGVRGCPETSAPARRCACPRDCHELTWDETYIDCDGRPRIPTIPGHEFSGVVDAVTPDVAGVKAGDAVYALSSFCRNGSAAEYIAIRSADLAPKPRTVSFEQAAAVPLAGLTAWQALFDHAQLQKGQRVLIHGGAGGVGTYAVQLASWKDAEVITTASAENHDFLRELGASEVIDYTRERFEETAEDVDVVLDTIGGETQQRSWGILRRGGILISIVSPVSAEKAASLGLRSAFFIVEPKRSQLIELGRLIDAGTLHRWSCTAARKSAGGIRRRPRARENCPASGRH